AYLGREECPDRRTGWRFRRQEIQTALPAPLFIANNSRKNGFLHLLRRGAGIQNSPCLSKHFRVVDFKLISWIMYFEHKFISSNPICWVVVYTLFSSFRPLAFSPNNVDTHHLP